MLAASSRMVSGAASSQSSGFRASGSGISAASTQSAGLESVGSSISRGGRMGGVKSVGEASDPSRSTVPSIFTAKVSSGRITSVYTWLSESPRGRGGSARCRSSTTPVTGLRQRMMRCTLSVLPQRSGPNMMRYGVCGSVAAASSRSDVAFSSLTYAPPQVRPSCKRTSYWNTNGLSSLPATGAEKGAVTAYRLAGCARSRP